MLSLAFCTFLTVFLFLGCGEISHPPNDIFFTSNVFPGQPILQSPHLNFSSVVGMETVLFFHFNLSVYSHVCSAEQRFFITVIDDQQYLPLSTGEIKLDFFNFDQYWDPVSLSLSPNPPSYRTASGFFSQLSGNSASFFLDFLPLSSLQDEIQEQNGQVFFRYPCSFPFSLLQTSEKPHYQSS